MSSPPVFSYLAVKGAGITDVCYGTQLYMGAVDLNSGPRGCTARALPTGEMTVVPVIHLCAHSLTLLVPSSSSVHGLRTGPALDRHRSGFCAKHTAMVHLDYQHHRVWNCLGDKPQGMPLKEFLDWAEMEKPTLNVGISTPGAGGPRLYKNHSLLAPPLSASRLWSRDR